MSKIFIYGSLPPPYGGVTIHIKRLVAYLNNKGIKCDVYNPSIKSLFSLAFRSIFIKKSIIHVHGYRNWINYIVFIILQRIFKSKFVVTIHNNRFLLDFNYQNSVGKLISKKFYTNVTKIIVVNPDTEFGFIKRSKIVQISPFLKPLYEETNIDKVPDEIIEIRKETKFLITANAFKIIFFDNKDLYGIDLSIELMKQLVESGYKYIGFIYVIPDIGDYEYFEKMKELIKKYKLNDYFHFYTKPVAYPAILKISDIFIRPTNTDGYGVSIAEAISIGVPAIASNVCKRPEGTILFKNREINDLFEKARDIINNYQNYKEYIENIEYENNAEKIVEVYKEVINLK